MSYNIRAADSLKIIHIDERSKNRTICHLEFASVNGLSVDAMPAATDVYHSRVNNERYTACPYDLEMRYEGQVMRIDFGTNFDLESVKKHRHSSPVDSGFFTYDGTDWRGEPDTLSDPENEIRVIEDNDSQLISGLLHRADPNSKVKDYCYALTFVYDTGYATAGVCSVRKDRLKPWQDLLTQGAIIHYKP